MNKRLYVCLCCGHLMTREAQSALRTAIPCPTCNRHETFGPGVYVEDFTGYEPDHAAFLSHAFRRVWDGKRWPDPRERINILPAAEESSEFDMAHCKAIQTGFAMTSTALVDGELKVTHHD